MTTATTCRALLSHFEILLGGVTARRAARCSRAASSRRPANTHSASKGRRSMRPERCTWSTTAARGRSASSPGCRDRSLRRASAGSVGVSIRFVPTGGCTSPTTRITTCSSSSPGNRAARVFPLRSLQPAQRPDHREGRDDLCERSALAAPRRPDVADRPRAGGTGRGEVMSSERKMGTTNGIDLSPDEEDALCRRVGDARDLGLSDGRGEARRAAAGQEVHRFQPRRTAH